MFGYILPLKKSLKNEEIDIFRAYYCGICKSLSKRLGQIPRLLLNYDSTFFAVLLSAISDEKRIIVNEKCVLHHIKKRDVVKESKIVDYVADMNVILSYYNLNDKWIDDKSVKAKIAMLSLESYMVKLKKKYPEKCGIIIGKLAEITRLEKEKCKSIDMVAHLFAELMEEILCYPELCEDKKNEKILRWIGYNIGKWIYTIDAYDDIKEDIIKKNYNPIVLQYDYDGGDIETFKNRIKDNIESVLIFTLSEISKGYNLLNIKKNSEIIENIIYMGMLKKTEQILGIGSCKEFDESV